MPRIAVTGHVELSEDVAQWVRSALAERLGRVERPALRGITCLAKGADQIFARVVVGLDGRLDVVLPAQDYAEVVTAAGAGPAFHDLLDRADSVRTMPFARSDRTAYLAASEEMLDGCDLLLAVWDGRPSRSIGDTADVVGKARERRLPVEVFWPPEGDGPGTAFTPAEVQGPG